MLNIDEIVESYSLDGVYEEIIDFSDITLKIGEKTANQEFLSKVKQYLSSPNI